MHGWPENKTQDRTTNASDQRRGPARLPRVLAPPLQADDGTPLYSESGRYFVRLHVQGEWRRVEIDDRVPVDAQGFCLFPRIDPQADWGELWPLLLACGGSGARQKPRALCGR